MKYFSGRGCYALVSLAVLILALFVSLAPATLAQSESINGTIRGRITDPTGQPVAAATVTAVNNATGYTRTISSGEDGYYVLPTLPIGTYTVTITKEGFETLKVPNVVLNAGTAGVVDGSLRLGEVTQSVEVSGGAPVIEPARTNIGRTITETEVQNLPLTSRNPYNLIMFQPGISGHPNPELGIPRTLNTNGMVDRINYQMDGMVNTETDRYGLRLFPISDAYVSQVQTVSNSLAPEFGGTTGDVYNVITGSGTNTFHGMGEWIRGPVDTAARPILTAPSQPKPNLLLNSYVFNAGGPIKKDKLFYYAGYEHLYRALPVPNTVSASNITALEALGVPASEFATAPSVQHAQFLDTRVDWTINSKNQAFFRFNYFRNEYPFNTAVGGLNTQAANAAFRDRAHVYGLQVVSTLSTNLLNEFRASYPYRYERHIPDALTGPGPAVSISGVANINGSINTGDVFAEKIPSFNDNVTYIHGAHTMKFGVGFERPVDVQQGDSYTQYVFPTIVAYQSALTGVNPFAYTSVNAIIGNSRVGYISNFYDFFGQDAWQVRPSLLITYGIRYERFMSPSANPNAPYPASRSFRNPAGDVSPRLGIAWRLGDKTVVRASSGIYYDAPPTNLWYLPLFNDGSRQGQKLSLLSTDAGAPAYPNPLATGTFTGPPDVTTVTPNFKNAYVINTSLQITRQLTDNDAITIVGVNTNGRNLLWLHNINLIPTGTTLADGRPVFSKVIDATTRVNPAFNNVNEQDVGANSSYNALEINYEHRFSHGVMSSASYTWSHSISDAPDVNSFEQNLPVEDTTNLKRDRGNSYVNRPHAFTTSTVWTPHVNTEGTLGYLANNNQIAWLTNIASGDEQNITANRNLTNDSTVTSVTRPLFIGRYTVRGPKVVQFDMRYTRTFPVTERISAQFFTEANNVFNNRNVTSLNTVVPVDATGAVIGSLPTSFPKSSTVLQGRLLQFGLVARW
jgi:Carboxypeptidase regulatory-like domain/TonB dependent receptor-like, beta-barrel